MTAVAVVGDATTTTTVALAAGWPSGDEVIVLEADPSGGSLAAWFDTPSQPSLATIVANVGADSGRDLRSSFATFDAMTQRSRSGVRFVANAARSRAAHRALDEAAAVVIPALAATESPVLVDVGLHRVGIAQSPTLDAADVVVLVHRQAAASAAAATVRVERLVEAVEELARLRVDIALAVIGATPFEPGEIAAFVGDSVPGTIRAMRAVADDPLAAATIAGRAGVSARRLRRLPLMRDAVDLASVVSDLIVARRGDAAPLEREGRLS
jgi:cellulose biosynthesis protein BcsQ